MDPVTINNEQLRLTYEKVATIQTALQKELSQVPRNKSHLDKLVPAELAGVYSAKLKTAEDFADTITRTAYDGAVVLLVATFERVVFAKYRTSYGSLKSVVRVHSTKPLDYYDSRERFINDSIDKLAAVLALLENFIDPPLFKLVNDIKDHRNYIAHGKRDSKQPAIEYPLHEMVKILDDVILEIEK